MSKRAGRRRATTNPKPRVKKHNHKHVYRDNSEGVISCIHCGKKPPVKVDDKSFKDKVRVKNITRHKKMPVRRHK